MHACVCSCHSESNPACNVLFTCWHWSSLLGNVNMLFSPVFSHRARQKPITKETAMPGESKASRPLRVVLRRGTSLILFPPPPPRLRPEPLALPPTVNPAKRVREQKILTGVENRNKYKLCEFCCTNNHFNLHRMFRGLSFCWKMEWKICKNNKGM